MLVGCSKWFGKRLNLTVDKAKIESNCYFTLMCLFYLWIDYVVDFVIFANDIFGGIVMIG